MVDDSTKALGIGDYKTGAKTKPQAFWDSSVALTVYGLTFRAKHGRPPAFTAVEQMVATKVPKRVRMETTRTREDFDALEHRIGAVLKGIEAGVFVPCPPGSWKCSPKWCGYWASCPYINSERKAASERVGG